MRIVEGRLPSVARTMRFRVHESSDLHVSASIADKGLWEPFESEFLRVLLGELASDGQPVAVDCGANIGWYSVLAGVLGARVFAFEPMPMNASLLRFNVEQNELHENVTVYEMAVGDTSTYAELHLSPTNQGDHRLHSGASSDPSKERSTVRVKVERLDDVLAQVLAASGVSVRPHLMKLDTQGSEVAILKGARDAWMPSPTQHDVSIVTEFWPYGLARCGSSADEFLSLLSPLVDSTHVCLEIQEWSSSLIRRSASELLALAASPGMSLDVRGFTNLAFVANDLFEKCRQHFCLA